MIEKLEIDLKNLLVQQKKQLYYNKDEDANISEREAEKSNFLPSLLAQTCKNSVSLEFIQTQLSCKVAKR